MLLHIRHIGSVFGKEAMPGAVRSVLSGSQDHKARGLIYFPGSSTNWCGQHKDHGMLTGASSLLLLTKSLILSSFAILIISHAYLVLQ